MKYVLYTLFFCLIYSVTIAQDIQEYVSENMIRINHIDPFPEDDTDLAAIGKAIGNARIVMIGEQDHGDAPAFLAKTRLVKYLHEKKGFNVLAFESDFYGLTKGWEEVVKQPDSIRQFLKGNIFPYWTRSDAFSYLLNNYLPHCSETNKPLHIAGLDSQLLLNYSYNNLRSDLNQYLLKNDLAATFSSDTAYQSFLEAIEDLTAGERKPNTSDKEGSKLLLEDLERIQKVLLDKKDTSFWSLVIDNLIAFKNNSNKVRDKAMSENLKFLANDKYKEEKIIVWAHNAHIIKYTDQIKSKAKRFEEVIFKNMGTEFTNDPLWYGKTYVLGFASYKGMAGRLLSTPYPVSTPHKNGLENWISENMEYGFLDFKSYNDTFNNPSRPFLMKAPTHFTIQRKYAKIPWNLAYDGIFFIREMYPVELVDNQAQAK